MKVKTDEGSLFLAIASSSFSEKDASMLSPQYMKWSENSWLIDLSSCLRYWQRNANGLLLSDFFQNMLSSIPQHRYSGALSPFPWQGILMMMILQNKGLNGVVHCDHPIGQTLYRQMSWVAWWQALASVSHHSPFQKRQFGHGQRLLKRAIDRLGLGCPMELQQANLGSMTRRFGSQIGQIWEWTVTPNERHIREFPWSNDCRPPMISDQTHLDHPVWDWQQMRPLLQESVSQLCQNKNLKPDDRILAMHWSITFHDLSKVSLCINFQHPLSLFREEGRDAVLTQAYFIFKRHMEVSYPENNDELIQPAPPIVSWQLIVSHKISLPPRARELFPGENRQPRSLIDLENLLPVKLKQFTCCEDWVPENSYEVIEKINEGNPKGPLDESLMILARKPPLFYFRKPQLLETAISPRDTFQFTEKTMDKWWSHGNHERSYYKKVCAQKMRTLWIFRDLQGKWYVHGIFA